jgi:hypothetical protein
MCNCCYRAYSTPPWWVTMGYAPRHQPPAAFQPTVTPQIPFDQQPLPLDQQPLPPDQQPPVAPQTPADTQPASPVTPQTPADTQSASPVTSQTTDSDDASSGSTSPPAPPPTINSDTLVINGTVNILQPSVATVAAGAGAAEATVEAHRRADDTTVATTTTDALGNFSLSVPTGGMPFDGYLTLTKSGLLPARVYVSRPLTSSIQIGNVFLTSVGTLSLVLGLLTVQARVTEATVIVSVRDSVLSEVKVDEVYLQQNTEVGSWFVGDDYGLPPALGTSGGSFWAFNVPPGPTAISATSHGWSLGPAQITAIQGLTFVLLIVDQTQSGPPVTSQTDSRDGSAGSSTTSGGHTQPPSGSPPTESQDITVGGQPNTLAFDGNNIWVLNLGGYVSAVSPSGSLLLPHSSVMGVPWAAASAGTTTWVASSATPDLSANGPGYLTALDPTLGNVLQRFVVSHQPIALALIQYDDRQQPFL